MSAIYEKTALTPLRVAQMSGYLDWSWQPSMFKCYPDFLFSYKYGENTLLKMVELSRFVSAKTKRGKDDYYQLNTPSAGNLHPVELYVQVRGVKGILSGIYHVNPQKEKITLIKEIAEDGVEAYIGLENTLKGFVYLISGVPFRSEWKYGLRAFRYIYLDIGHQVAALLQSMQLVGKNMTILSDFDSDALNDYLGFRDEEFIACAMYSGEMSEREVKKSPQNLMYVSPLDYSESSQVLQEEIVKNGVFTMQYHLEDCTFSEQTLQERRSARAFSNGQMAPDTFDHLFKFCNEIKEPLQCYTIVLQEGGQKAGVYYEGRLLQEGQFATKMASLLVDQNFVKNAQIITVVCSQTFSHNNLMLSGVFVQELYIQAESLGAHCSGIGAFYDKKLQKFLQTDAYILYVSAVGI